MKTTTQRRQQIIATGVVLIALLWWAVMEWNPLLINPIEDAQTRFVLQISLQLLTLCAIPVALTMMHFSFIKKRISDKDDVAKVAVYARWSIVRLLVLGVPLLLNSVAYYLCGAEVGFFYLAVICLLSLFFVFPTEKRRQREIQPTSQK
ncbi:MAG: hypothetical protein PUG96_07490 [Prevotellaceae bacterium]|nr:hypothetical protein [Prevotellaceae bacterium]